MRANSFDPATARDRLLGAVFGAAVGDALGLQVEGDDPARVAERFPGGAPAIGLPYAGAHRGYAPGDWTDATDGAALAMRALAAYFAGGADDPARDLALRVAQWGAAGFPELGDTCGLTPDSVTARAAAQPAFASDPVAAARAVLGPKASNGALTRAIACAFTVAPEDWAALLSAVTHSDERCGAAAATLAALIGALAGGP